MSEKTTEIKTVDAIHPSVKKEMMRLGFTEKQFTAEAQNALQIWNNPKNKYLRTATQKSFLISLVNLCKIGLSLNPVKKEAYLVPRKNGDNVEVCLEPSYIGLIKLLTDAGTVKNIQTNLVYEGDEFNTFFDANGTNFKHVPYYSNGNKKGDIKGVYCLAFLPDGNKQFEFMDIDQINGIKETSETYKKYVSDMKEKEKNPKKWVHTPVWVNYESEMIRKTILRRIYKYLPHSKEDNYIQEAINLDESAFSATNNQVSMIESLLLTANLQEIEKMQIESELVTMTYADATRCINHLQENQIDPVNSGNYSQTDILNKLNQIT